MKQRCGVALRTGDAPDRRGSLTQVLGTHAAPALRWRGHPVFCELRLAATRGCASDSGVQRLKSSMTSFKEFHLEA